MKFFIFIAVLVVVALGFHTDNIETDCGNVFYNGRAPIVSLSSDDTHQDICHACRPNAFETTSSKTEELDAMCKQDTSYCRKKGKIVELKSMRDSCPRDDRWTVRSFEKLEQDVFNTKSGEFLALRMDESRGIPKWVAYRVTSKLWEDNSRNDDSGVPRTPSFYKDPDFSNSISDGDYKKQPNSPTLPHLSGNEKAYVRGHVAFNKIFSYSTVTEVTSNFYSNIAPQLGHANHPFWFHGAENKLLNMVMTNQDLEYYVVSGTAGGIQFKRGSCLHVSMYPSQSVYKDPKFRNAVPALWYTAFVAIDPETQDIRSSGGWIGHNYHDTKTKDVEVKSFDHVEDLESELRTCCESSTSSSKSCEITFFPGLLDADTAPSCADLRLVKECKFANLDESSCSSYCTSQGSSLSWGPHVCGFSASKCVNGATLGKENRFKCRDECGSNTEPPQHPHTCEFLVPVRACKSLGHDQESCESSCTDHGTFWHSGAHRCIFVDGTCRNGGNADEDGLYRISRKCIENTCFSSSTLTLQDITATSISRMREESLLDACQERKLRAVHEGMAVGEIRKILRFYEAIPDRIELDVLIHLKDETKGSLVKICERNELYDPPSSCSSFFRFRSTLENIAARYLKPHLSKSDIDDMSEAELRAALRKRGLLESGLESRELKKELKLYECWSPDSEDSVGYERCRRESITDKLMGMNAMLIDEGTGRFRRMDVKMFSSYDK